MNRGFVPAWFSMTMAAANDGLIFSNHSAQLPDKDFTNQYVTDVMRHEWRGRTVTRF
jgi:hypothetical protein